MTFTATRVDQTQYVSERLVVIQCCKCQCFFAIPLDLQRRCFESGKLFYCPHGHSQVYVETEVMRLNKQIAEKQRELDKKDVRINWLRSDLEDTKKRTTATQRRLSAAKGQQTKLKRRIAHGVCPCCHRVLKDLQAHMKSKHPDYEGKAERITPEKPTGGVA